MFCCDIIEMLGQCFIVYFIFKSFYWLYSIMRCYSWFAVPIDYSQFGSWAIVTGGTDGIGAEYVRQLADLGQNIIIVGRNEEKLTYMKLEVEQKNRKCKIVKADLSLQEEISSAEKEVEKLCEDFDVGILINNAGVAYKYPEYVHSLDRKQVDDLINVNCASLVMFAAVVAKQMVKRQQGLIVNIASQFGRMPAPLQSLYGATKAYVLHLSNCLFYEYEENNVHVQCIAPMMVATKMTGIKKEKSNFFAPAPEKFVNHALCTPTRLRECSGYLGHEILQTILKCLPECVLSYLILDRMKSLRTRVLKRQKSQ